MCAKLEVSKLLSQGGDELPLLFRSRQATNNLEFFSYGALLQSATFTCNLRICARTVGSELDRPVSLLVVESADGAAEGTIVHL